MRLGVASRLRPGVTALKGRPEEVAAAVMEATGGLGADVVVDAAGPSATLRLSLDLVRRLGTITKVGWGPQPVGFSLDLLLTKAVTLQGTYGHGQLTWYNVLRLLGVGLLKPKLLISEVLPIEQWQKGYEDVESSRAVKVILKPE